MFKELFYKKYFDVVLISDENLDLLERFKYLWNSLITFAPIAFLLKAFNIWFIDNGLFFTAIVGFIFTNMVLGGYMHWKKRTFSIESLLKKTITMTIIVSVTYIVLELILRVAGQNMVTTAFQIALQVSTLLYPAGKILKNIFILSDGEHPPKWIMERIYNFQENGDLAEFLNAKKPEENQEI